MIETKTVWPDDLPDVPQGESERGRIEERLHADPAHAAELDYVRLHAGFIRKITVTAADLERLHKRHVSNLDGNRPRQPGRAELRHRDRRGQSRRGGAVPRPIGPRSTHVVLITDDHVHRPHAMQVAESLGEQDIEVDVIVVTPGEESKSLDVAAGLWQGLLELGADRQTVVAAVGGGVVGDLAGFVAATYARGLRFLQVPTTLLAQVDSAVGGKVGINLPEAKNMIGAFHQPLGVLVDTATLATLPDKEYRAGLAEVVKYGAVLDAAFFEYLEDNAAALLERKEDVLTHVDRPLLPPEGRRCRAGRTRRERAAGRAELRPHLRPRLRDPLLACLPSPFGRGAGGEGFAGEERPSP